MTELVSFTLPLQPITALQSSIQETLEAHGQPLRWAITAIEGDQAMIEAVVMVIP
jgi:hypothetical protein